MEDETIGEAQIRQLPLALQRFLVWEQMNLWKPERLRPVLIDPEFDPRYLPEGRSVFRLPCFWILKKHLYVYGEGVRPGGGFEFQRGSGQEAEVLFPIHPAELPRFAEFLAKVRAKDSANEGTAFFATPTSSTRTLLAWQNELPNRALFAKLSLCTRMLGDRKLQRGMVARSIGLSKVVAGGKGFLPPELNYFPEVFGMVARTMPDWGAIFRAIPEEISDGRVIAAPLFALTGGGGESPPLLLQLLRENWRSARALLEQVLLSKFASIWVSLVFDFGLMLEAHGQDLMMALSPDGDPLGGLYYRDFEGLAVDWMLRRARGLPEPASLPHAWEWFSTYETWGYPMYQMVFCKLRTSLYDYLYFVLTDLRSAIEGWRRDGLLTRGEGGDCELTLLFSKNLRRSIRERFDVSEERDYDIYKDLNRFVKFLMRVRMEVIRAGR